MSVAAIENLSLYRSVRGDRISKICGFLNKRIGGIEGVEVHIPDQESKEDLRLLLVEPRELKKALGWASIQLLTNPRAQEIITAGVGRASSVLKSDIATVDYNTSKSGERFFELYLAEDDAKNIKHERFNVIKGIKTAAVELEIPINPRYLPAREPCIKLAYIPSGVLEDHEAEFYKNIIQAAIEQGDHNTMPVLLTPLGFPLLQ